MERRTFTRPFKLRVSSQSMDSASLEIAARSLLDRTASIPASRLHCLSLPGSVRSDTLPEEDSDGQAQQCHTQHVALARRQRRLFICGPLASGAHLGERAR